MTVLTSINLVVAHAPFLPIAALLTDTDSVGSNTFTTDILDPLTGLTAASDWPLAIELDWTATPDTYAAGYNINRSTTQGCCYTFLDSVVGQATVTYTDGGVLGTYYYVVEAYYQNWTSAYSNEATIPTGASDGTVDTDGLGASPLRLVGGRFNPGGANSPRDSRLARSSG